MLDIKQIRETPDRIADLLASRGFEIDVLAFLEEDKIRRSLIAESEELKNARNTASKEIGHIKKAGGDASTEMEAVRDMGSRISAIDAELAERDEAQRNFLLSLPNLPDASVPLGLDETANRVARLHGEAKTFTFTPKPHWDITDALGIVDFKRSAKFSGAGFPMFIGPGSRLARGLVQYMLDLHTTEHGYTEVEAPFLVNSAAVLGTGQLPKFPEEMYYIGGDDLWLIPTAEVPLTNFYREEIMTEKLPVQLTGYTPCFRREAGAAGKDNRGLNRVHQFDKVELVQFVEPSQSFAQLEKLLGHAETVLQRLGLHYRILELCTGDLGFSSAKTYDIELWAPGQQTWLEVSSCSNFLDFQARRLNIRYRDAQGKPAFIHTLNGSGVALPRLLVALIENGQQEDGSIELPPVLAPYLGGQTHISAPAKG